MYEDVIIVATADGTRSAVRFGIADAPLEITHACLLPHSDRAWRQPPVGGLCPTDKAEVERAIHHLHTELASRALQTRESVEQQLDDVVHTVNQRLARR